MSEAMTDTGGDNGLDELDELSGGKDLPENPAVIQCLRCNRPLSYLGHHELSEGIRWGVDVDLGHLLENRVAVDLYTCAHCGHTELFNANIGTQFRPSQRPVR